MAVLEAGVQAEPLSSATGRPHTSLDQLEALRGRLRAGRTSLLRFERRTATFEVVAASGIPFLASGVRLPIAASSIVLAAYEGHEGRLSPESSARPLDRIASSLGLHSGVGIPLTVAGTTVGAVTALWEGKPSFVPNPGAIINGSEVELLRMLLVPESHVQRILVCHEDPLIVEGLAHLTERQLGARVDTASTVTHAIATVVAEPPDLVVCSDRLSSTERLPQIARRLRAAGSAAPLLALVRADSPRTFEMALEAGVTGYLPLASAAERLSPTAATLLAGRTCLHEPDTAPHGVQLTEREQDVLLAFERGLSDKEIALDLGVAVSTVKTHARSIYGKLQAPSRTAALHKARVNGLI